eukprot:TRINITY_DN1613_c1_g1_i1.p1 TRINITY_DN1613_c1_g1~~TRINITY_DN1613_c1_g1_i1.p1  ORF type:complete len:228 (+),score=3.58 TRINITY_DN1613_c1_g1_i1:411-1094(+)
MMMIFFVNPSWHFLTFSFFLSLRKRYYKSMIFSLIVLYVQGLCPQLDQIFNLDNFKIINQVVDLCKRFKLTQNANSRQTKLREKEQWINFRHKEKNPILLVTIYFSFFFFWLDLDGYFVFRKILYRKIFCSLRIYSFNILFLIQLSLLLSRFVFQDFAFPLLDACVGWEVFILESNVVLNVVDDQYLSLFFRIQEFSCRENANFINISQLLNFTFFLNDRKQEIIQT